MKDYYKIGEISKIYGIGRDSLMYYEEIGILNPLRDTNGYRMYSIYDIWKLNLIKELRSLNFSMKKIKEYLDDRTVNSTNEMLEEQINLIDKKIEELLRHKKNITKRIESIKEVKGIELDKFEIKYIEKRKAIKLNADIKKDEDYDFSIQKLQKEYEDRFSILGNNNIGAFFNLDAVKKNITNEFKAVFCLLEENEEIYNIVLEDGYYLTLSYKGNYTKNKTILKDMLIYIEESRYKIKGDPIEIYKIDIHETGDSSEFVSEIQIPIIK